MRDRLIETLGLFPTFGDGTLADKWMPEAVERLADHLLAEGVILPPCKVGQPIWHITRHYDGRIELREGKVSMLQQKADKSWKIRISVRSSVWDFTPSEI